MRFSKAVKKFISIVVATILVAVPIQAFADDFSVHDDIKSSTITLQDGSIVTEKVLTYDEALALLMEKKEISAEEASLILKPNKSMSRAQDTAYHTRYKTDYWANYEVEIGGIWLVYNSGSFREFREFKSCWTAAPGTGDHTWNQLFAVDKTVSYPTTEVILQGRGTLEVPVSNTVSASVTAGLTNAGFSVSGSTSTTTYYRKTGYLNMKWNLYS